MDFASTLGSRDTRLLDGYFNVVLRKRRKILKANKYNFQERTHPIRLEEQIEKSRGRPNYFQNKHCNDTEEKERWTAFIAQR